MTSLRYPHIARKIAKENYIEQLCNLFTQLEDLEATEQLYDMNEIFKMLVMRIRDNAVLEILFNEKNIIPVIGALEYEMDQPHVKHREFLSNKAVFKSVIPLSEKTVTLINQTYKIQYIKDVILGKIIGDVCNRISILYHVNELF